MVRKEHDNRLRLVFVIYFPVSLIFVHLVNQTNSFVIYYLPKVQQTHN